MSRFEQAMTDLTAELAHWPGWHFAEVSRSSSAGSRDPEGKRPERECGWFRHTYPEWVAIAKEDGWDDEAGHHQGPYDKDMVDAIAGLTAELHARRTNPHSFHVMDPFREGRFVTGCSACEREAHELFADEVDWSPS